MMSTNFRTDVISALNNCTTNIATSICLRNNKVRRTLWIK